MVCDSGKEPVFGVGIRNSPNIIIYQNIFVLLDHVEIKIIIDGDYHIKILATQLED